MHIIIKFIIRNILEKKFRTFLILISIMLSSALFFASSAMTDTMVKMFADRMRQSYGATDIIITPNEKSPSSFLRLTGIKQFEDRLEYAIGLIEGSASYKVSKTQKASMLLYAFNLEELQKIHPVSFYNKSDLQPFDGNKIILSKATADKYGLKEGEMLDLNINGLQHKFKISALAYSTGLFIDESQVLFGILPLETLASYYNAQGRVGAICIKAADPTQKQVLIKELSAVYKRYTVKEPFSLEELKQQTASMTTGFYLMSLVVIMMSIFIIYTSFKVITMERLPIIGTFRSVGSTRKMTDAVLLIESLLYGVIGGILGCVLGLGILYIMAFVSRPVGAVGFNATVSFTPGQMAAAFMLAIVLSLLSCILPILKISRIPVKDIILNIMEKAARKTTWKLLVGLLLLVSAFVAPYITPDNLALPVSSISMFSVIASVVMLVPYITAVFIRIFEKLYAIIFGNVGMLAAKNLKENKSILNNISLLAIGISSLLMINTISSSVVIEVANLYREANFGIWMTYAWQGDRNLERVIRLVDGVVGTYGIYEERNVEIDADPAKQIALLQGIDVEKYPDYWDTAFAGDRTSLFEELNKGKNIIVSTTVRDKFKLNTGDRITLTLKKTPRTYRVIGFMNTLMYNGSIAMVSENNLKMDTGNRYYSNIYIKTSSDPFKINDELQKRLSQRPHYVMTVRQMEYENSKSNENIFILMKGFSILALIIGIFGILNNLIISFIERRRSMAMLRSVGMSRKQILRMIFIEALSGGLIGGITGVVAGFFLIWEIPFVMNAINLPVPLSYPYSSILTYILAGIAITVAASGSPAIKSSKMNLIDAIKYE